MIISGSTIKMVKKIEEGPLAPYWKAFVEGLITTILLGYFMPINLALFLLGLILIIIDLGVLLYSIIELKDPKFLAVYLLTELFIDNSK